MNYNEDYLQLSNLYIKVADSIKGMKLSPDTSWIYDAENLAFKLFNHIGSLFYLAKGTKIPGILESETSYIDHPSITILSRAALETYLTFYYIFIDPKEIKEKIFRHKLWQFCGFKERQKFYAHTEKVKEKIKEEKKIIEELYSKIESSAFFKKLKSSQKKQAINGEWRLGRSWADLAEIAGFDKDIFHSNYKYLCSYAHSSSLSALQIGQATQEQDQRGLCNLSLQIGLIILSHFIFSYSSLFDEAKEVLNLNKETLKIAKKWKISWKEFKEMN